MKCINLKKQTCDHITYVKNIKGQFTGFLSLAVSKEKQISQ